MTYTSCGYHYTYRCAVGFSEELLKQYGSNSCQSSCEGYDHIAGWVAKLRRDCPQLRLLVIGETGVGRSTLINNLLGEEVAGEEHM